MPLPIFSNLVNQFATYSEYKQLTVLSFTKFKHIYIKYCIYAVRLNGHENDYSLEYLDNCTKLVVLSKQGHIKLTE
jgi:hypothetical protein